MNFSNEGCGTIDSHSSFAWLPFLSPSFRRDAPHCPYSAAAINNPSVVKNSCSVNGLTFFPCFRLAFIISELIFPKVTRQSTNIRWRKRYAKACSRVYSVASNLHKPRSGLFSIVGSDGSHSSTTVHVMDLFLCFTLKPLPIKVLIWAMAAILLPW